MKFNPAIYFSKIATRPINIRIVFYLPRCLTNIGV